LPLSILLIATVAAPVRPAKALAANDVTNASMPASDLASTSTAPAASMVEPSTAARVLFPTSFRATATPADTPTGITASGMDTAMPARSAVIFELSTASTRTAAASCTCEWVISALTVLATSLPAAAPAPAIATPTLIGGKLVGIATAAATESARERDWISALDTAVTRTLPPGTSITPSLSRSVPTWMVESSTWARALLARPLMLIEPPTAAATAAGLSPTATATATAAAAVATRIRASSVTETVTDPGALTMDPWTI